MNHMTWKSDVQPPWNCVQRQHRTITPRAGTGIGASLLFGGTAQAKCWTVPPVAVGVNMFWIVDPIMTYESPQQTTLQNLRPEGVNES